VYALFYEINHSVVIVSVAPITVVFHCLSLQVEVSEPSNVGICDAEMHLFTAFNIIINFKLFNCSKIFSM